MPYRGKEAAYNALKLKGYFMPAINSPAITAEYLLKCMLGQVFRLKIADVKAA
jgi:hypothetical protein